MSGTWFLHPSPTAINRPFSTARGKRTGSCFRTAPFPSNDTTFASENGGRAHSNAIPFSVTRRVSMSVIPIPFPWNTNTAPSPRIVMSETFRIGRNTLCGCGLSWFEM